VKSHVLILRAHPRSNESSRKAHGGGRGDKAGAGNDGPGAPASLSAMPLQHPSGRSPGSQAGVYPGAAPSRAVVQWRSAAPLLAYRCGGSAGIALKSIPERTGFPFHPVGRRSPPGHLKPAHYLRRDARLSIGLVASPACGVGPAIADERRT
jgi:hypothetical protein